MSSNNWRQKLQKLPIAQVAYQLYQVQTLQAVCKNYQEFPEFQCSDCSNQTVTYCSILFSILQKKNRNRWYPLWRPVCSQFFTQPAWEEDMSDRGSIQMSRESTQEMQAWGALLKRNTKRLCQINQHVKQLMQKEHPFAYEKTHKLNKRRENWSKLISINFLTCIMQTWNRGVSKMFPTTPSLRHLTTWPKACADPQCSSTEWPCTTVAFSELTTELLRAVHTTYKRRHARPS